VGTGREGRKNMQYQLLPPFGLVLSQTRGKHIKACGT